MGVVKDEAGERTQPIKGAQQSQEELKGGDIGEGYLEPGWAGLEETPSKIEFEVIEMGNGGQPIVKNLGESPFLDIKSKQKLLIGRQEDTCDIVILHNSVSRTHAVIQHHKNGEVFIYDMGSTHGTFVNNQRVASREFVRIEDGFSVKFGECPSMFVVKNEAELEAYEKDQELELQKYEQEQQLQQEKQQQQGGKQEEKDQKTPKSEFSIMQDYMSNERSRSQAEHYYELLAAKRDEESKQYQVAGSSSKKGANTNTTSTTGNNNGNSSGGGIGWGMIDEAEVYLEGRRANEILDTGLLRRIPNLTDNQVSKIEKFEKRLRKINRMQKDYNEALDFEKMANKVQKQQNAQMLNTLENRMTKMSVELAGQEEVLKQMFGINKKKSKKNTTGNLSYQQQKRLEEEEDYYGQDELDFGKDNDDFLDRTKEASSKLEESESLKKSRRKLKKKANSVGFPQLLKNLQNLKVQRSELNEKLVNIMTGNVDKGPRDSLDDFMDKNDAEVRNEQRSQVIKELKEANSQFEETNQMLKIIKPDFDLIGLGNLSGNSLQTSSDFVKKRKEEIDKIARQKIRSKLQLIEQRNQELQSGRGVLGSQVEYGDEGEEEEGGEVDLDFLEEDERRAILGKRFKRLRDGVDTSNSSKGGGPGSRKRLYGAPSYAESVHRSDKMFGEDADTPENPVLPEGEGDGGRVQQMKDKQASMGYQSKLFEQMGILLRSNQLFN